MELGCEPFLRRYYLCQITCGDFPEVDSLPTNPYPEVPLFLPSLVLLIILGFQVSLIYPLKMLVSGHQLSVMFSVKEIVPRGE